MPSSSTARRNARLAGALLALAILAVPAAAQRMETYSIDPVHSTAVFAIRHYGVSLFHGQFDTVKGEFRTRVGHPNRGEVRVVVDASSVNTGNSKRDDHLRSADFFHAAEHPEIVFESTRVYATEGSRTFFVIGNLTMVGKTRPVRLRVEHVGTAEDPRGNVRAGYKVTGSLRRSDFELAPTQTSLGDEVELIFGIEGIRQ